MVFLLSPFHLLYKLFYLGCIKTKSGDPDKTELFPFILMRPVCFGCSGSQGITRAADLSART